MRSLVPDKVIPIDELRKAPEECFTDQAVAVSSDDGKIIGYLLDTTLYEEMMSIIRQSEQTDTFEGSFQVSEERLREIVSQAELVLSNATDSDLDSYSE